MHHLTYQIFEFGICVLPDGELCVRDRFAEERIEIAQHLSVGGGQGEPKGKEERRRAQTVSLAPSRLIDPWIGRAESSRTRVSTGSALTGLTERSISMPFFSMTRCVSPNFEKASLACGCGSRTPISANTSPKAAGKLLVSLRAPSWS